MGVFFVPVPKAGKYRMSLYSEFLADAKEMIADFGVAGSANSGAITFSCLISDPAVSTVLEAGGIVSGPSTLSACPP